MSTSERHQSEGRKIRRAITEGACAAVRVLDPDIGTRKQSYVFELVDRLREELGKGLVVSEALNLLGVSKAGYYKWRKNRSKTHKNDNFMRSDYCNMW